MNEEDEMKEAKRELFSRVFNQLNSMLDGKEYLITNETYSEIDIAYYNEIKGVQALSLN